MTIQSPDFWQIKSSPSIRNDFLDLHKPFAAKVASSHCGRYLVWGQDDELSIALIAFNQAIDAYRPESNVPFLAFARKVIERRLTDFFRKESRSTHLALAISDNQDEFSPGEVSQAWDNYLERNLKAERIEEIKAFSLLLKDYRVRFAELETSCPKHKDSRELLTNAANSLVHNSALIERLLTKKQLPIKDLAQLCHLSPKTLEKSRKYIIATALLLYYEEEYIHLREFVQIPKEGRA